MLEIEYNPSDFIPLRDLDLSEKESLNLFWKLRTFFEDRNPGHIIDASDVHIITVLPFANGDEIPDDYDVTNYAVGMINDKPALLKLDENQEILVLEGAEEEFLTNQHISNNDEALPLHVSKGCPFCNFSSDEEIIAETPTVVAVFDKYPVSPGHTLIIPKRHIALYRDLSVYEMNAMTCLLEYVKKKIDERYHPDGYNVGINIGEAAGQSVFHCHMHVIPRYKGDVPNPKGGVRGVIPSKQSYSAKKKPEKLSTSAKESVKHDEI